MIFLEDYTNLRKGGQNKMEIPAGKDKMDLIFFYIELIGQFIDAETS
ncbi:MAG: hypothetical protein GY765_09880 [bacterium]|nr:hypothetical protein [bacterium]